ncbi:hypothetical protein CC117_10435 [Parafrankia colletiae]|uniref:Uncharacterized protein n=1 Tax=Parafrankia colletiae TaxID=573497 RepID=A0A1S1REA3_9ACTN|nr:hypothetical protein CC117_10435 [Parafrankia colletiae]
MVARFLRRARPRPREHVAGRVALPRGRWLSARPVAARASVAFHATAAPVGGAGDGPTGGRGRVADAVPAPPTWSSTRS